MLWSQQHHAGLLTGPDGVGVPQGTLHLTDVGLAQQQHGHPGLADAAPHGQGQLTVEQHPVEGEERFHYGVDLAANEGTEILCFADGTVTVVGESSSYGKYCMVEHAGGYSTLYAHCSRITVSSGAAVKEGQKIAEVGETGVATGPHLHFELQKNGTYLNPIYYVD